MSFARRLAAALAFAGLILISAWTELSEACFTRAVVASLRLAGFSSAVELSPTLFAVGPYRYIVNYWCTPSTLALCLLFLLWFAGQRARHYLAAASLFALAGTLLLLANVVLCVHLNRNLGVDWAWAHRPGLVAVYLLCLGACLIFVLRRPAWVAQTKIKS
ncbi:MAG: hypothetical protein ACJ75H_01280 [Thermoanaerobaculia bacterium]